MKKAILYLRVRTDDKNEQQKGWAEQEKALRRYCTINKIEILKIYRENCSAGEDFFDRPEFIKLYRYLKLNRSGINLILFQTMDRFSRRFAQYVNITELLKHLGVEVQAMGQNANVKELTKYFPQAVEYFSEIKF